MVGYKGFDWEMKCNGQGHVKEYSQYECFREDVIPVVCRTGMHFCKEPFDVLQYYPVVSRGGVPNLYAMVSCPDFGLAVGNAYFDEKCATNELHIGGKMDARDMAKLIVERAQIKLDDPYCAYKDRIFIPNPKDRHFSTDKSYSLTVLNSSNEKCFLSGFGAVAITKGYCEHIITAGYGGQLIIAGHDTTATITQDSGFVYDCGAFTEITVSNGVSKIYSSGYESTINVMTPYNQIFSTGKRATITAFGFGNAVRAGIGSSVTFAAARHRSKTFIIDGEKYKDDKWYVMDVVDGDIIEWTR